MLWRDAAYLIEITAEPDADGYVTETETGRRSVYVDVQSVKRSEFYAAKQSGANIIQTFLVRSVDYSDEKRIEHKGTAYRVERAYTKGGEITELNCSLESVPANAGRRGVRER